MISSKDAVKSDTEWKENYKFHPFSATKETISDTLEQMTKISVATAHPIASAGIATVPEGDKTKDMGRYMDRITNHMLAITTKKLRQTLNKYVNVTVSDVTALLPEILYYVRFAEYIEKLQTDGFKFCKAKTMDSEDGKKMNAKGIYNFKLAAMSGNMPDEIVQNDLEFSPENRMYILTGANRGGKTTITQAVGLLFVLAQGGIYVPGDSFEFDPVDCIYTHFPADEDKTMDLGRLGEECKRFREIYTQATCKSLILLNETFSTTSFEEGYYIAKDSIKAILQKGCRTIYNTHMHKLAYDINDINQGQSSSKAASLIVKAEEGNRSFKVEIAPPEGMSYARDIAKKYGVTYEMLTENKPC
jgi:DNA mismatch repair ATPase MutS